MATFICNSKECEGRIFESKNNTSNCIHCGSDNIRQDGKSAMRIVIMCLSIVFLSGLAFAFYEIGGVVLEPEYECEDPSACNYMEVIEYDYQSKGCYYAIPGRTCDGSFDLGANYYECDINLDGEMDVVEYWWYLDGREPVRLEFKVRLSGKPLTESNAQAEKMTPIDYSFSVKLKQYGIPDDWDCDCNLWNVDWLCDDDAMDYLLRGTPKVLSVQDGTSDFPQVYLELRNLFPHDFSSAEPQLVYSQYRLNVFDRRGGLGAYVTREEHDIVMLADYSEEVDGVLYRPANRAYGRYDFIQQTRVEGIEYGEFREDGTGNLYILDADHEENDRVNYWYPLPKDSAYVFDADCHYDNEYFFLLENGSPWGDRVPLSHDLERNEPG